MATRGDGPITAMTAGSAASCPEQTGRYTYAIEA
jgi:hypothetical protein